MANIQKGDYRRVLDCLLSVPLPQTGRGAQSASVAGAIQYAYDMRELKREVRRFLSWDGDYKSWQEIRLQVELLESKAKDIKDRALEQGVSDE